MVVYTRLESIKAPSKSHRHGVSVSRFTPRVLPAYENIQTHNSPFQRWKWSKTCCRLCFSSSLFAEINLLFPAAFSCVWFPSSGSCRRRRRRIWSFEAFVFWLFVLFSFSVFLKLFDVQRLAFSVAFMCVALWFLCTSCFKRSETHTLSRRGNKLVSFIISAFLHPKLCFLFKLCFLLLFCCDLQFEKNFIMLSFSPFTKTVKLLLGSQMKSCFSHYFVKLRYEK